MNLKERKINAICKTIKNLQLKRDTEQNSYYKKMYQERIDFFHQLLVKTSVTSSNLQ